jgi:predicted transcriptional regulator
MKIRVLPSSKTFRCHKALADEIDRLAKLVDRHASDIMREAISSFVAYYRDRPAELRRLVR